MTSPAATSRVAATMAASPAPRADWHDIAASDPDVLVCQTPEWTDAVCTTGRYQDASRLYELADGRRFVLPLVRRRRWPGPSAPEASFPSAWGIGGLAGRGIDGDVVAAGFDDLIGRPHGRISIRPNPLHGSLLRAAAPPRAIPAPPRAPGLPPSLLHL